MSPLALALALAAPLLAAPPKLVNHVEGPYFGCDEGQRAAIDAAADEAGRRVWAAKMMCAGLDVKFGDVGRRRCLALDERLMGKNDEDITSRLGSMYVRLVAQRDIRCAAEGDPECTIRSGYFDKDYKNPDGKPGPKPLFVCPNFFSEEKPEGRVRLLVHETAHAAGISESLPKESYCIVFTCDDSCGKEKGQGWLVADNWSQLVHCASGQRPDDPRAIMAPSTPPAGEPPSPR